MGPMLGHYQKYTPKPHNIAELKTALLSLWNDLPQGFINKAIPSFRNSKELLQSAADGHCENTQFKYREGS